MLFQSVLYPAGFGLSSDRIPFELGEMRRPFNSRFFGKQLNNVIEQEVKRNGKVLRKTKSAKSNSPVVRHTKKDTLRAQLKRRDGTRSRSGSAVSSNTLKRNVPKPSAALSLDSACNESVCRSNSRSLFETRDLSRFCDQDTSCSHADSHHPENMKRNPIRRNHHAHSDIRE